VRKKPQNCSARRFSLHKYKATAPAIGRGGNSFILLFGLRKIQKQRHQQLAVHTDVEHQFQTGCAETGKYVGIIFVMFSGARRLELRQDKNYGGDPEYQAYVKSVPILLPFVPIYSVKKYKWLVA